MLTDGEFLYRANVARFERVLRVTTDETRRRTVTALLAHEHKLARERGWTSTFN